MIYTVTLNPCLDYLVAVPDFRSGRVNRAKYNDIFPGGKGINVSYELNILKQENLAFGLVAGFTGSQLELLMDRDGVKHDFVHLKSGHSRIDVQMADGMETSILGIGPHIDASDIEALCEKLQRLEDGDTLVISGSIPRGAKDTVYRDILQSVAHKELYLVVDAKGPLLLNTLKFRPFLIKPNRQEIVDIFYQNPDSVDDIIRYAKNLQNMGARNVLVSLSAEGAVLVTESGEIYRHSAMEGKIRNTVGCGDSMLAGFITGYHQSHDMMKAFQLSLAAASANAFHESRGSYEDVMRLLDILENESNE